MYSKKPHIVAFSETWLSNRIPKFINYYAEWQNRVTFGGGLGFLVKKGVQYKKLTLNPYHNGYIEFQAIKVKVGKDRYVNILNIYNPGKPVQKNEFKHYIQQLGNNYILVGDFNAHSKLLDTQCVRPNYTGVSLEALITEDETCLINPINFYTYINPGTGKRSCLDLCLSSPSIAPLIDMSLLHDIGSDHDPVHIIVKLQPLIVEKNYPRKWKVNDKDLLKFKEILSTKQSEIIHPNNLNKIVGEFTDRIYTAASETIKRTTGRPVIKKQACWWNDTCRVAVAERRTAKRNLEKYPSKDNIEKYKQKTAQAKKVCIESKRKSFQSYIQSLTYDTPTGTVWRKIKSLKTNMFDDNIIIEKHGELVSDPVEKANLFASHMENTSKCGKHIELDQFEQCLNNAISNGSMEAYNGDITCEEVLDAVNMTKHTSPGLDEIPNSFIKNFPPNVMQEYITMVNQSFSTGVMPDSWKVGAVVPIVKPGKPKSDISSYRPITLLPCLGKVLERVIQRRLQYFVDENSLLSASQYGFCKGASTMDIHMKLEHVVRKCLGSRKSCIVVYVDLSSAFDVVWPKGLIWKLINKNLRGKMVAWLYNYFDNRMLKVRVDGCYSDKVKMEAGTPQGAVLSPLLFNLMLADLPDGYGVTKLIYADDITLISSGADVKATCKNMQCYLRKLEKWMNMWGMILNPGKTYMQYYTRRRIQCPILRVNNRVVEYKKVHKLLGLFYDSPLLTWKAHIDYLQVECLKRLDLMKTISSVKWGASSKVLRTFYIAYIRAKIDYGSILYCTASVTSLRKLDIIQNSCLRLMLGALKSSPILSLEAEAHLPSLELRRGMLSVKNLIKLSYKPINKSILDDFSSGQNYLEEDFPVNSFMRRALLWCKLLDIKVKRSSSRVVLGVSPWNEGRYLVKDYNENVMYNNESFLDYVHGEYSNFDVCFTDGSKVRGSLPVVGSSIYFPAQGLGSTYRLHPGHSVIFSELFAIEKALDTIKQCASQNFLIFSDSESALQLIVKSKNIC